MDPCEKLIILQPNFTLNIGLPKKTVIFQTTFRQDALGATGQIKTSIHSDGHTKTVHFSHLKKEITIEHD